MHPTVTKIGLILLVALFAIWLSNNVAVVKRVTS